MRTLDLISPPTTTPSPKMQLPRMRAPVRTTQSCPMIVGPQTDAKGSMTVPEPMKTSPGVAPTFVRMGDVHEDL
jgi:hypothetical protein